MHNVRLIFNPFANHQQAGQKVRDLRTFIDELGGADWVGTEYPTHASKLAAEAALEGYETVIAVGGDGTVHEVINGLMKIAPQHRPKLGIIPVGSGNDFAASAGISFNLQEAARRVFEGQATPIDVASICDGSGRLEYWMNSCGIGLDGQINIATRKLTWVHGFWMYFVALMQTVFGRYYSSPVTLWVDGVELYRGDLLMLTLGNGPREGGGFQTTPDSQIDDGWLDYCRIQSMGRLAILLLIPRVLRGAHGKSPQVALGRFKRLKLDSAQPMPIHIDGEVFGSPEMHVTEVEVEIMPRAVQLYR